MGAAICSGTARATDVRSFGLLTAFVLGFAGTASAQTGPNNPSASSNLATVGTNAWSNTGNGYTSNDTYSTVAAKGISNFLVNTGYGFGISDPSNILGIQLDVEKSTLNPLDVAQLDGWTSGLTKTVSAGLNRCLIVVYCQENGTNSRDINAMNYGGQAMTQLTEVAVGTPGGFYARLEVWMLLDAQIALASNTTITPNYVVGPTLTEYTEIFTSVVYQHVDQLVPVIAAQNSGAVGTTDPHQLSAAITTIAGGMAVNAVTEGNNTTPASTNGGTNTYAINSGYTEGIDVYFANGVQTASGACLQTADKSSAANGSEQPSCDFTGTVNRWAMIGFTLRRARELDEYVMLVKGGAVGGNNLAALATAWGTTDAYASYGGSTNLWGQTWTVADVNAADFGAALSARVQNGTVQVDHIRLSIWSESTLPIELVHFGAVPEGDVVHVKWITATEQNNDHFIVQRSRDGITFYDIEQIAGAGNSTSTLFYDTTDPDPIIGTSYYRLQQIDVDNTTTYSPIVSVTMEEDDLVVYPNPTLDGIITVYDVRLEQDQVAIYTPDMKLVRTHVGAGADPVIHLNDLPDGIYVLMVRSGDSVRTRQIVKASILK